MPEPSRIRALSLWRPWPALILADHPRAKRTENRGWDTAYRGWFVLHGGQKWDPTAEYLALRLGLHDLVSWHPADHPTGFVGTARLDDVCSNEIDHPQSNAEELRTIIANVAAGQPYSATACPCDEWAARGQRHWGLGPQAHAFTEVIPCNGRQGWWYPPEDASEAVAAQLAETAAGVE